MSYEEQFTQFWEILISVMDMDDDAKAELHSAWSQIKWPHETSTQTVEKETKKRSGKLNGYNLFMREKLVEIKTTNPEITGKDRMPKVASLWNALSDALKQEWSDKAKALSPAPEPETPATAEASAPVPVPPKVKAPRKITGYNRFMSQQIPELKAKGVPHKERMEQVGKMWQALTEAEKKAWNTQVTETPTVVIPEPSTVQTPTVVIPEPSTVQTPTVTVVPTV